jgi:hypothetical protein
MGNPMFNQVNNINNNMFEMSDQNNLNLIPRTSMNHLLMTKEKHFLSLIFSMGGEVSSPVTVQCKSDDKMNKVVEKWFTKCAVDWKTRENYQFIFNSKAINMDWTVEENGIIMDNAHIFVVKVNNPDNKNKKIEKIENKNKPIFKKKKNWKINLIFMTTNKINTSIIADDDYTFKEVAFKYCDCYGIAHKALKNIKFIYNSSLIKPEDIPLRQLFGKESNVTITVIDPSNIIGA